MYEEAVQSFENDIKNLTSENAELKQKIEELEKEIEAKSKIDIPHEVISAEVN